MQLDRYRTYYTGRYFDAEYIRKSKIQSNLTHVMNIQRTATATVFLQLQTYSILREQAEHNARRQQCSATCSRVTQTCMLLGIRTVA